MLEGISILTFVKQQQQQQRKKNTTRSTWKYINTQKATFYLFCPKQNIQQLSHASLLKSFNSGKIEKKLMGLLKVKGGDSLI